MTEDIIIIDGKKYIKTNDVARMLGKSRVTVYNRRKQKDSFPKPIILSKRDHIYPLEAVEAWIKNLVSPKENQPIVNNS